MIEIKLFGETRVVDGDRVLGPRDLGGVKPRRILEYLALHAGHPVTKDRLIEALWGDCPPDTPKKRRSTDRRFFLPQRAGCGTMRASGGRRAT